MANRPTIAIINANLCYAARAKLSIRREKRRMDREEWVLSNKTF